LATENEFKAYKLKRLFEHKDLNWWNSKWEIKSFWIKKNSNYTKNLKKKLI
jgi:hypothetical protein